MNKIREGAEGERVMRMSRKCSDIIPHSLYDSFSVIRGDGRAVRGVVLKARLRKKERQRCRESKRTRLRLNGEGIVTSLRR